QRPAVLVRAALDQRRVGDAEAGDEPARVQRLQRAGRRPGRGGVATVDVGDAGTDHHALGRAQVQLRGGEGLAAHRFAEPQCRPALRLQVGQKVVVLRRPHALQRAGPQADTTQLPSTGSPVAGTGAWILCGGAHSPECDGSGTRSARLAEIANRDARPATRGHTVPGRPTTARGVTMFEWSETDLMIRDGIRGFIAKEIRPHLDALDSGEMSPYPIIRKLFSEFGIDVMASEAVEKMLAKERARDAGEPGSGETGSGETGSGKSGETSAAEKEEASSGGSGAFEGQDSLMAVVVSELAGACMGMVSALGVSIGLGATT